MRPGHDVALSNTLAKFTIRLPQLLVGLLKGLTHLLVVLPSGTCATFLRSLLSDLRALGS